MFPLPKLLIRVCIPFIVDYFTFAAVTKNDMEESRHIRFAHPISATYYDESSGFLVNKLDSEHNSLE